MLSQSHFSPGSRLQQSCRLVVYDYHIPTKILSFVQFQRELPVPPVSFRSVPEETLSFLLNTTCHLLMLGAACCSEQILYWFPDSNLDSDWIGLRAHLLSLAVKCPQTVNKKLLSSTLPIAPPDYPCFRSVQ